MSDHSKSLILYGAGSPLIVDVEESCSRGGREPVAIIRNRESSVYALNTGIVVTLEQAAEKILNSEILFPQFTPGNRQVARNECAAFLQEQSGSVLCDAVLADPSAQIAASCAIGAGTYVNSLAAIGGATRVGAYGLINRGCLVGHHVEFGCFVSLGPGVVIGGMVKIGKGSVIGARAVVLPQISVGENSVVAAGAVVTRDVPAHCMVAGNPAELRKTDISGYNGLTVK